MLLGFSSLRNVVVRRWERIVANVGAAVFALFMLVAVIVIAIQGNASP